MRFCPFCSAENADELAVCGSCGRRLPPLPPRRARNAPPTGVLLPPRATTTTQPPPVTAPRRSTSASNPPPLGAAQPGVMVTSAGLVPVAAASTSTSGLRAPASAAQPGAPATAAAEPASAAGPADESARTLASALSPGPAAQRREAPPAAPADPLARARRRSDQPAPSAPTSAPTSTPTSAPAAAAASTRPMPSILTNGPRPATSAAAAAGAAASSTSGAMAPIATAAASSPTSSPGQPSQPTGSMQPGSTQPGLGPAQPGAPAAQPAVRTLASPAPPRLAQPGAADPPWATGYPRLGGSGDPDSSSLAAPLTVDAARRRNDDGIEPPPTRVHRPEQLVDRPFTPPQVSPIPEIPEPGLVNSARYAVRFAKARWQRRGAIRALGADIKKDTDALDQVLGALGGVARTAKVDGRVFFGENAAINSAEQRGEQLSREYNDVDTRKLEENAKFIDVERERNAKLAEAERMVDEAQKELAQLETQRRGMRDKRKELERRQKAYLKAAEDSDRQTGSAEMGDSRQELRRAAEQHRREAAALEPERQDIDRRLGAIERPIGEATVRLDAAKAELDAAKRSLADAREGHTHRLAELDAEQKRKGREIAQAEAEIARRLVTLGTLVNLNRIEDPQFAELYGRIDRLRGAITARTTEIEKLTAEREAYDRGNLVRGIAALGGAVIVFIALIVILRAALVH